MVEAPQRAAPYCFGSNCCAEVPQDKWVAVERFGRFSELLGPGCHCLGPDCCSAVISLRSMSNRIMQQEVNTMAKLPGAQEGLWIKARVAIQFMVDPDNANRAFYHLTDVEAQIETFVVDAVQSTVQGVGRGPMKERLERNVYEKLQQVLPQAGFKVEKTLLTGWFFADMGVADAEKEIARARHQVASTTESAEADKIRTVKAAEADADAKRLQGEGMARQRAAIVDGLRDSFEREGSRLGAAKVSELLLISQYYSTLRDISTGPNSRTVFLPGGSSAPSQQQM
mmetsp:Transcript_8636/g.24254  ORF Transcript_8636/g.24254 Transcript_8636/m.24254 type:complete len:284 (-) Transcript_8636:148-999(-)